MKVRQTAASGRRRAGRRKPPAAARTRRTLPSFLICAIALLAGCTGERAALERKLLADKGDPVRREGVLEHYLVQCPDVIELRVSFRPELSKRYRVAADGCIDLGDYGRLRIEGKTPAAIGDVVAQSIGAGVGEVRVRVAEFQSQHLLIFGQVVGWQRTVPYEGQETVLDVLQRVGGITPGAEPREVYVVRSHVLDDARPEIFQIDLDAIVVKKDMKTNIRLLPYDQVYVGETVRSRVKRNFPAWCRPLLQVFWNTQPAEKKPPE